ncbi:MAG: HAMP domain-containing protein [Anaerolineae bacterium]|nr:HAMP domain-containing protein [Anaerolineae bacterium]
MKTDRFADLKPAVRGLDPAALMRDPAYVSLRWRLLLPLFGVLLTAAMIAAYLVTATLVRAGGVGETSQMQLAWQGTQAAMREIYDDLAGEAARVAYLRGVPEAMLAGDAVSLRRVLEPEAVASDLDLLLVVGADGTELAGLRRGDPQYRTTYAFSTGAALAEQVPLSAESAGGVVGAPALIRLADGFALAVNSPVVAGESALGQVVVARRLPAVLDDLRSGGLGQIALFSAEGRLLQTTFDSQDAILAALALSPEQAQAVLASPDTLTIHTAEITGYPFQMAYRPFVLGQSVLGVLGVYLPSSLPYAADLARQMLSLTMASLAAAVVIGGYVAVGRLTGQIGDMAQVMRRLADGDLEARTGLRPVNELGELGRAVDVYADRVQQRQESLRTMLRRQRRESARLTAMFEALPDGVVVQDLDGRVILINEQARQLLGAEEAFENGRLGALTAAVTDLLGPALAPGLYALGAPHRIPLDERVLSAQAAAILSVTGRRVGTVIALRDITEDVQREETRDRLLEALAADVQEPLAEAIARHSAPEADPALQRFASEVIRSSVRLQQMIGQLRDLTDLGPGQLELGPRPLALDDLFEGLLDEWRVAAEASGLTLVGRVMQRGLYVLGDERRLRWALGNLLDNAIKYSLPGSQITLLVRRHSDRAASIIIQDGGVGIAPEDMPHIFTRFFRGRPRAVDGTLLRVPGMGQGLFIARRVLEAHGGALKLQSQAGRGTQADCLLPLTSPVTLNVGAGRDGVALPVRPPVLAKKNDD